jgi:hypothetical protein
VQLSSSSKFPLTLRQTQQRTLITLGHGQFILSDIQFMNKKNLIQEYPKKRHAAQKCIEFDSRTFLSKHREIAIVPLQIKKDG